MRVAAIIIASPGTTTAMMPNTALEPTASAPSVLSSAVIRECSALFMVASPRRGSALDR